MWWGRGSLLLALIHLFCPTVFGGFRGGRIFSSNFDLNELNGMYYPGDAVVLCEQSPICAAFTYRGLKEFEAFPDKKYETFFFKFVDGDYSDKDKWAAWVTYFAEKDFATYNGIFDGYYEHVKSTRKEFKKEEFEEDCPSDNYTALVLEAKNSTIVSKATNINLSTFTPSDEYVTLVSISTYDMVEIDDELEIDTCPDEIDQEDFMEMDIDMDKWVKDANDITERVPCDISPEEFTQRFILPRVPTVLTGCADKWMSTKMDLTIPMLLEQYHDDTFEVSYQIPGGNSLADDWLGEDVPDALTGSEILTLMQTYNATFKIFDRVGTRPRRPHGHGDNESNYKPRIFDYWNWPEAVPRDLLVPTFGGTDYAWVIISSPFTGTKPHVDPDLTVAWNIVLQGRKHWIVFPPEANVDQYKTDKDCQAGEMYDTLSWYMDILPQLRNMTWHGKKITEIIISPGETIFVPSVAGHTVINLDDTLSFTENPMSIEDVRHELTVYMANEWGPMLWESKGASERIWRNLMSSRDLLTADERKYARAMLNQTMEFVG